VTDLPPASRVAVLQSKHQRKALNQLPKDPRPPQAEPQKIDNYTLSGNNVNCNSNYLRWKKKKQKMKNGRSKKHSLKGLNSLLKRGRIDKVLLVRVQRSRLKNLKKLILTRA
jgi:hypothetical protein